MIRVLGRFLAAVVVTMTVSAGGAASGPAAFLEEGVGARWAGMGGAARAVATDAQAGLWNPANLSAQGPVRWQAGTGLAFAALDRTTGSLAGALQTDGAGGYALAWVRRAEGGLERVDAQGNVGGVETAAEDTVAVSGGWAPFYRLRAGVTVKFLHRSLLGFTASGAAADVGLRVQPLLGQELFLALTGEDLAGTMAWNSGAADRPARGVGGAAAWALWRGRLLLAADAVAREAPGGLALHAGAEFRPIALAAVRAGWDDGRPTAGASYLLTPYQLDYAFTFDPDRLATRHQLSFAAAF